MELETSGKILIIVIVVASFFAGMLVGQNLEKTIKKWVHDEDK